MVDIIHLRRQYQGLLEVTPKVPVKDSYSLSLVYTPGVGRSCLEIKDDIERSYELTNRANSIAVLTDCSVFPDFENINPLCGIPTVEVKALQYREFAGIDAYPIVVNTHDVDEIVRVIQNIAPTFAGFDLDNFLPERTADIESWLKEPPFPIIYSYRSPNILLAIEDAGMLGKINPNIIHPAIMRAALDVQAIVIDDEMYGCIGAALRDAEDSGLISNCAENEINLRVAARIAKFIAKSAYQTDRARITVDPEFVEEKYLDYLLKGKKSWFEEPLPGYESTKHTIDENSLELHRQAHGVIEIRNKVNLKDIKDFESLDGSIQTDKVTKAIEVDHSQAYDLTPKGNLVAIITDGSAVLGLGNIGAEAALPVMEGKAVLFKSLAGVDAMPICLKTQDVNELIDVISHITPALGGINLEDISSPRCFEIERKLIEKLHIPVFHDDQHGTAVVVLAGFMNALKLAGKKIADIKVVVNGAGAGAISVSELLLQNGVKNLIICDTRGAIYQGRKEGMNHYKEAISYKTNPNMQKGNLADIMKGADFFVGLSVGNIVKPDMVKSMGQKPVVFALANPTPEIMPELALEAGAFIVATGRSDFKNQINNSLAFPGIFRGTLDSRAKVINNEMKLAAARAIAGLISEEELNPEYIIPHALDLRVPPSVAKAVAEAAIKTGSSHMKDKPNLPDYIFERTKNYLYEGFLRR